MFKPRIRYVGVQKGPVQHSAGEDAHGCPEVRCTNMPFSWEIDARGFVGRGVTAQDCYENWKAVRRYKRFWALIRARWAANQMRRDERDIAEGKLVRRPNGRLVHVRNRGANSDGPRVNSLKPVSSFSPGKGRLESADYFAMMVVAICVGIFLAVVFVARAS